ncbi:hypothetical protein HMPREF9337_02255 [Cutibacterium acnes HL096PA3]|nr:hypothetical protein HMPREF9337_02255 [Cutibacterium acnes HL096PA3]
MGADMGVSRVSGSFGTSRSPKQDNSCHAFCEDRGHEVLEAVVDPAAPTDP